MSSSIYTRLAFTNLKNNRKTYIPYIFTAILTIMMYYIIDALSKNKSVGNGALQAVLSSAVGVVVVFAVIFLFYTNSFLIKRRKKEIGMYNILGMGKRHIAKMLVIETFTTAVVSIAAGLICGVIFSKLMWLIFLKILNYDVRMNFEISTASIVNTLFLFAGIFFVTLVYNLWQIRLANPVELLRGGNQGEKEPKTKWLLTVFGIVMLGFGYYIAFTTESPLTAVQLFFVAVICVVLGTYALFVAGSIALLKILKKRKNFYYQSKHFTAVSGMIYRMKQNAVGLANICILCTMVLVMISTTVSLYVGMDDVLKNRFPRAAQVTVRASDQEQEEQIQEIITEEAKASGVTQKEVQKYHCGGMSASKKKNRFTVKSTVTVYDSVGEAYEFYMIPQEDYNKLEGKHISLKEDEVLVYDPDADAEKLGEDTIKINNDTYRVVKELNTLKLEEKNSSRIIPGYYVIVKDKECIEKYLDEAYRKMKEEHPEYTNIAAGINYIVGFDLEGSKKNETRALEAIKDRIEKEIPDAQFEARELSKESFYMLYGGLLFIGIYLGFMFLMATVLIIYYKQISEGYDDRERYQIMQKVGMSKREVRRSIRSQVLIVFFLPLVTAVIHISVAFKVITKLLAVLNLVNVPLFFICTVVTVAVFAVFYAIVFAMTAREYYKIVN